MGISALNIVKLLQQKVVYWWEQIEQSSSTDEKVVEELVLGSDLLVKEVSAKLTSL